MDDQSKAAWARAVRLPTAAARRPDRRSEEGMVEEWPKERAWKKECRG
jgi:hypothetical protein